METMSSPLNYSSAAAVERTPVRTHTCIYI